LYIHVSNVYFRNCDKSYIPLRLILLFFFVTLGFTSNGQEIINWYTWEEGMTKAEDEPKKFIIDLYTDWCGWCKRMDKVTFQNPAIAAYINENYIAIKFNAEQKGEINFKGTSFKFIDSGRRGYHALAAQLTNGKLSYPTVIFLDEEQEVIQSLPGFLDAETFAPVITYFANDMHTTTPWAVYLRRYQEGGNLDGGDQKKNNYIRLAKGQ